MRTSEVGARTIGEVMERLVPGLRQHPTLWQNLSRSPPDIFALCAAVLRESGAYRFVVESDKVSTDEWREGSRRLGDRWAYWAIEGGRQPRAIRENVQVLRKSLDESIEDLRDGGLPQIVHSLFVLLAAADESCRDLRYFRDPLPERSLSPRESKGLRARRKYAFLLLARHAGRGTFAGFDRDRVKIVQKLRVPRVGLTIRSVSRYLAADFSELQLNWCEAPHRVPEDQTEDDAKWDRFNILLLPWPMTVRPSDFHADKARQKTFGVFRFRSKETAPDAGPALDELVERFLTAIDEALRTVGDLDAVVLPEGSLSWQSFSALFLAMQKRQETDSRYPNVMVAGSTSTSDRAGNFALLGVSTARGGTVYCQPKQHRWLLEARQISQYQLGATIHPGSQWWEKMPIERRTLHLVRTRRALTICPLICEDLARLEPVGEVIRAVGPTLVLALLLDGPQLEQRWPGRYATVLADDPGCSVVTLTAYGMCERCWDASHRPSGAIALWKDPRRGVLEVSIGTDDVGVVLSTALLPREGRTADGRSDDGGTFDLVLGGVQHVKKATKAAEKNLEVSNEPPLSVASASTQVDDSKLALLCEAIVRFPGLAEVFVAILSAEMKGAMPPPGKDLGPLWRIVDEQAPCNQLMAYVAVMKEVVVGLPDEDAKARKSLKDKAAELLKHEKVIERRCGEALAWALWSAGTTGRRRASSSSNGYR